MSQLLVAMNIAIKWIGRAISLEAAHTYIECQEIVSPFVCEGGPVVDLLLVAGCGAICLRGYRTLALVLHRPLGLLGRTTDSLSYVLAARVGAVAHGEEKGRIRHVCWMD